MRRVMLVLAGAGALALLPDVARARVDEKGRPFARGTLQPSLGGGASFGGSLSVVSIALGARYFVLNGVGPGLSVSDTIFIYSDKLRADYPGIASQTPTNLVRILPNLQWVFVRTRWFSPYVIGGVGPVFYNHGGGTLGTWMAGGGAFIGLGGPVFVDLGVGFTGVFPQEKCEEAFYYEGPTSYGQVLDACSFTWGPRLGLTIAFGVGGDDDGSRKRRRKQRQQQEPPPEPQPEPEPDRAWEPPQEPEPTPEPEAEVEPEPQPDAQSDPPADGDTDPDTVEDTAPPPDDPPVSDGPEGPEPPSDDDDGA